MELNPKWSWVETDSKQFSAALDAILNTDDNLFLIGPAGVGKSILLKIAYDHFRNVLVLGPTGISAANLSTDGVPATTIHSALKIPPVNVYNTLRLSNDAINLITRTKLILIDEISMVNASLMDFVLKASRLSSEFVKPRIIIFGDIFQLPPVRSDNIYAVSKYFDKIYDGNYFFFSARLYEKFKFKTFHLNEVYRQKDPVFKNALNRIRLGVCTQEDLDLINTRVVKNKQEFIDSHPYMLYLASTNKIVNKLNLQYTARPEFTKRITYEAILKGDFDIRNHPGLDYKIEIAQGQQVICTANNSEGGYQNGTLGIVEDVFEDFVRIRKQDGTVVYVIRQNWDKFEYFLDEETDEVTHKSVGSCNQIACKPAFAVTFHKSQGLTLDSIFIDLSSKFVPESGVYLALSRCRTLEGIGLSRPITMDDIIVSAEALEFMLENFDEENI
jgi:ATP-dependent exoDNAse (exonuclease V) alpha subunit